LVLDLDNTLWGGVLGEQGIEGVQLSDEGWTRCYHDFQKNIQLLAESGVILALCSKNDEPTAIAAIDNHPYMILRWKSFAAWRINWNDKATNLVELSKELNIGLDSFVFIDDSAYERGLIKASLPEVFVPDFPDKPEFLPDFIANLDCFETFEITHEDEERNRMYDEERKRKAIQQEFPNYENFLTSLNILVHIEEMNETNIGRISQIFARTNQFNFSGVKYTTEELKQLKHHTVFCIRYKDNIGDLGIVGAAVVAHYNQDHLLENMAISCRSLSRGVEEYFFKSLQHKFPGTFRYSYKPTAKNEPVRKFIESLSIDYDSKELPPWIKHLDQWS
jgi:FkbH-like protein